MDFHCHGCGEFGLHDIEDGSMNVPFALSRLQNGEARRQYDSSDMGPGLIDCDADHGTDDDGMILQHDAEDLDVVENVTVHRLEVNNVNELSSEMMRNKLITHFEILFLQNKVKWPRRI